MFLGSTRMASRWILGTVLLATGCISIPTVAEIARTRASRELRCPSEKIEVTARPDIDIYARIVDVEACGKVARYAVSRREQFCIREPDPDPAALDAFKATSHSSPSR
jgi:hypothetical protein